MKASLTFFDEDAIPDHELPRLALQQTQKKKTEVLDIYSMQVDQKLAILTWVRDSSPKSATERVFIHSGLQCFLL